MTRLHVVQTSAHATVRATATGTAAATGDRSRLTHHADALRGAWIDGQQTGVRLGYMQGWRYGLACGALGVIFGGLLCGAVALLADRAGWLPW